MANQKQHKQVKNRAEALDRRRNWLHSMSGAVDTILRERDRSDFDDPIFEQVEHAPHQSWPKYVDHIHTALANELILIESRLTEEPAIDKGALIERIREKEHQAMGHVDYVKKIALYALEGAEELSPALRSITQWPQASGSMTPGP